MAHEVYKGVAWYQKKAVADFLRMTGEIMCHAGFRLSPIQAKNALLQFTNLEAILSEAQIPLVNLTPICDVPECRSLEELLCAPEFAAFEKLAEEAQEAPYLKIYPPALCSLLKGLKEHEPDAKFKEKKLQDLLWILYSKILSSMEKAAEKKEDIVHFGNAIESIYQEIRNVILILEPYREAGDFEKVLLGNFTEFYPRNLGRMRAFLKSSAMRVFSSVLAGVEQEKRSAALRVLIHKDSYYYEADQTLCNKVRSYSLSVMDSERYTQGVIAGCIEGAAKGPFDLFIAEFNHNVSVGRRHYRKEQILIQIKELLSQKLLAEKCTILIDTTICLANSNDINELLADATIRQEIGLGRLNIVLIRSAQKFDMLGFDDLYGGIAITINQAGAFESFLTRMDDPDDAFQGDSFKGLTHIQKYAGSYLDLYRLAVIENSWALYSKLPKAVIYYPESENPIQISAIEEPGPVFLDLKFPNYPEMGKIFFQLLSRYAKAKGLTIMPRPSFSFLYTTYISIDQEKNRITPGLEGPAAIQLYADFFTEVQQLIETILDETKKFPQRKRDSLIAEALKKMNFC